MKYLLIVKGDTNDADYVTNESELAEAEFETLRPVLDRVADALKNASGHNWGRSEYSDECDQPEVQYADTLSPEDINIFDNYVPYGEHGIHSIESIKVHKVEETIKIYGY